MPIYEYECQKCKAHIEILQKLTDKPLAKCRKCGGRLEKQWSQSGIQFKGSGWYVTDYASKKAGGKEASDKEASGKEEKATPASESKTADKAATKDTAAPPQKAVEKKGASSNTTSGD